MFWGEREPNLIENGLYITDYTGARNKAALKKLNVTHILSAVGFAPAFPEDFKYHVLHIDDSDSEDILSHFPGCIEFIREGLKGGGGVVVHCAAGISRSSSVCIAFLMSERGRTFEDAYQLIKLSRPCIDPNPGFRRQLKLWGEMKFTIVGETLAHKRWRVMKIAREYNYEGKISTPLPVLVQSGELHCCSACQEPLFAPANIISHDRELTSFGGVKATDQDCDLLVVEPMSWMADCIASSVRYGAIECPKCKAEVGCFSWHGEQCSCGSSLYPAFQIRKEKLNRKGY